MLIDSLNAPTRIAIAVSSFNDEITGGLLKGARTRLSENNVSVADSDIIEAPGAFELPLIAQTLARTNRYDGIICLGCVIKGETAHFEYISLSASLGLLMASLSTELPITFGILTTYTTEQAEARSCDDSANKGREAAEACLRAIDVQRQILEAAGARTSCAKPEPKREIKGSWDILTHWPD